MLQTEVVGMWWRCWRDVGGITDTAMFSADPSRNGCICFRHCSPLSSTERVQWKLRDGNGVTSQPVFFRCREWLVGAFGALRMRQFHARADSGRRRGRYIRAQNSAPFDRNRCDMIRAAIFARVPKHESPTVLVSYRHR